MTAVAGKDPTLALKCLDLCQALVVKGLAFSLSLTSSPSSGFTFSLDTRKEESTSPIARKKLSPSTLRRNARRRTEFLKRKAEDHPVNSETTEKDPARFVTLEPAVKDSWSSEVVKGNESKSVVVKLKKKPKTLIPQLDGETEEVTSDAAVQTYDNKPETTTKAAQTTSIKPMLEISEVQQTSIPGEPQTQEANTSRKTLWTQTLWTIPVDHTEDETTMHTFGSNKPYRPPHYRNKT